MNAKHQKVWQRPWQEYLPGVVLLVVCLVAAFFLFAGSIDEVVAKAKGDQA